MGRVALLATLGAAGCDSTPSEPPASGEVQPRQITIEQVVEARLGSRDSVQYRLQVQQPSAFVAQLSVDSGTIAIAVLDSLGATLGTVRGEARGQPTGWLSSGPIRALGESHYGIRATGAGVFRVRVTTPPRTSGPEWIPAAIAIGDTVTGEDIHPRRPSDQVGDVDDFTFEGRAGDEVIVYVQAVDGNRGFLTVRLFQGDDTLLVYSAPQDLPHPELELRASRRVRLRVDGEYRLRLGSEGLQLNGFEGAYRFQVRRVDRRPERHTAPLPIGQTVAGESIDYVGDVDEFVLAGEPGSEYNILFRVTNGDSQTRLRLDVPEYEGNDLAPVLGSVLSRGGDSLLTDHGTGRFALPATGRTVLRVWADGVDGSAGTPVSRGPYELRVHSIDRGPESAAPALQLGDSVMVESIEVPADVDEYLVTVSAETRVNLVVAIDPTSRWLAPDLSALEASLIRRGDGEVVATTGHFADPRWSAASGATRLTAGQYLLRVQAMAQQVKSFTGAYSVYLYALHDAPEVAPATLAIGDTISGEALDPPGDTDLFFFDGVRGDHVEVLLQGPSAPRSGGITLLVHPPTGSTTLAYVGSEPSSPSLGTHRTGRITLAETGRHRILVQSLTEGTVPADRGPYRVAVVRLPATPEHHPLALSVGDAVSGERLDTPGDVDEFVLGGTPGEEVVVFLTATPGTAGLQLDVLDRSSGVPLASAASISARESSGRFVLPASGEVLLRVSENRLSAMTEYRLEGAYTLESVRIDRAPEQLAAAVAVGDTVSGEALFPAGDVDEFLLVGTAGERVELYFQTPMGVVGYAGLVAELVAPGSGTVLASVQSHNPTASLEDQGTGAVMLPVTSTYVVRVRGVQDRTGTGEYRFTVRLVP